MASRIAAWRIRRKEKKDDQEDDAINMEEEEQKVEQKEAPTPNEMYTLQWWRPSSSLTSVVCGQVFNGPKPDPWPDGQKIQIDLDVTLNLNNLQEGSVVTTKGGSLIRLDVRQMPIPSQKICEQEKNLTKRLVMYHSRYTAKIASLSCLGGADPHSPRYAEMMTY